MAESRTPEPPPLWLRRLLDDPPALASYRAWLTRTIDHHHSTMENSTLDLRLYRAQGAILLLRDTLLTLDRYEEEARGGRSA